MNDESTNPVATDQAAPQESAGNDNPEAETTDQAKYAHIVYALHAVGFFIGLTFFAAVILNYVKKDDITDPVVASHFRWQIRTFWFALLWTVIGTILSMVLIGFIVLGINALWMLYRLIKGWMRLSDKKAMYT